MEILDSEHSKNLNSDEWRKEQLLRHLSNRAHPFHRFGTGSRKTLTQVPTDGPDIRSILLEFYSKYYSPDLMKLVVFGKGISTRRHRGFSLFRFP